MNYVPFCECKLYNPVFLCMVPIAHFVRGVKYPSDHEFMRHTRVNKYYDNIGFIWTTVRRELCTSVSFVLIRGCEVQRPPPYSNSIYIKSEATIEMKFIVALSFVLCKCLFKCDFLWCGYVVSLLVCMLSEPNTPGKFIVWFRNETTLLVLWQPPYPPGAYTHYKVCTSLTCLRLRSGLYPTFKLHRN